MKFNLLLLPLLVLGVLGCQKKETTVESNATATEQTQTTAIHDECDTASSKNGLVRALSTQINQSVDEAVNNFDDAQSLDLSRKTLARVGELGLDLQNVSGNADNCSATMVVNLPMTDATYANRHFKNKKLPTLEQKVGELGIKLDGTTLTAPISYSVSQGVVSLINDSGSLSLIANTMAASAFVISKTQTPTAKPASASVEPPPPTQITPLPPPKTPQEPTPNTNTNTPATTPTPTTPKETKTESQTLIINETTTVQTDTVAPADKPADTKIDIVEGGDAY